jgi:tetratricopeptide (TPR) repeat protein
LCNGDENLISLNSLLYYSRANIFLSLKRYKKALADYKVALEYAQMQGDRAMEASIKNGLANIEADNGNIKKAEKIYQEIIKVFEEDNNIEEVIATYTNIALLYDAHGMYQLAQESP